MWKLYIAMALWLGGSLLVAQGADWPQWRGPERNGVHPGPIEPVEEWSPKGPPMLWQSEEEIHSDDAGGFGSPVVADGRVYLYENWKYDVPIETRTLKKNHLKKLEWKPDMPEELTRQVEEARLSKERANLDRTEIRKWTSNWVKNNVSEEDKNWRKMVQKRLLLGQDAVDVEVLKKLLPITGKTFPTEADLKDWFEDNDIPEPDRGKILKVIPTTTPEGKDLIYCFDAETGATGWKKLYPGEVHGWPSSATACIAQGRLYVLGSGATAYCLDAGDGREIWKVKTEAPSDSNASSSFVVIDGLAVLSAGPLTAYDAETGEVAWRQEELTAKHNSPSYWQSGGKTYLICSTPQTVGCVDPADGSLLWTTEGGGSNSSAAVQGNYMVLIGKKPEFGMRCYRISTEGAEELWKTDFHDRGTSALIRGGHVYAFGGRGKARAACVDLESGQVRWEQKIAKTEFSAPVAVGDRILAVVGKQLYLMGQNTEQYEQLARANANVVRCTSPAVAGERLFLRLPGNIACYDLSGAAADTDD